MNAKVSKLINEQINKEFYSAYLYLDFANYYAAAGLDGFENWYRVQAQEERAVLIVDYGKEVSNLERRMAELAAQDTAGRRTDHTRSSPAPEH